MSRRAAIPDAVKKLRVVAFACDDAKWALSDHFQKNVFFFYGFPGSSALRKAYRDLAEDHRVLKAAVS